MFLIHTLTIIVAIYTMSAVLAELIFSSELERKLPIAVRVGFGYFLSLLYFYGSWVCMSMRQAWALGILLLIFYTHGKFSKDHLPSFLQFKLALKKHLKLLGIFLILANIFFLPLHWKMNYGPFTEGGGDISVYSDVAKRLDDFNLSAAGFEEGASLSKRLDNIIHMINLTHTDDYNARSNLDINLPNADYQSNVFAFNFGIHSSIYTPSAQFHFLSGNTNYPAYFAVMAFLYACFILSIWGIFSSFGWVPAFFAVLLFTGSHSQISVLYNHYFAQAMSATVFVLFLGAVPHIRLFSLSGIKTYWISISTPLISNYNHFLPILLPLMTLASLRWFYPKSKTPKENDKNASKPWYRKVEFFIAYIGFSIFALLTHITAIKNSIIFFVDKLRSVKNEGLGGDYQGESLPIFSERWWTQIYGFLSQQHFAPFVFESSLVQFVIPWGISAGFLVVGTGLVMIILSQLNSWRLKEWDKKRWHYIGIYTALFITVILYSGVSQQTQYNQAKSAQYLLPCTYFVMLLPLIICFGSNNKLWRYLKSGKKSDWKFILACCYLVSFVCFSGALLVPRVVYLSKLGNQEDRVSIINPSYFSEVKRVISHDEKAFVLFEPRKSSDVYFGNQPFSGYRVIPTRHLFLRKHYKATATSEPIYMIMLPSEFITDDDLSHLWNLIYTNKTWKAERLIDKNSPSLYFTGHNYEKNFGLQYRTNRLVPKPKTKDLGLFSYLRNGTALVYMPSGGPYDLQVKVVDKNETNLEKASLMANIILSKAKAGRFKSLRRMKQDGSMITMDYYFEKSDSPRLVLVARYDSEYWFSARLNGKDMVAD